MKSKIISRRNFFKNTLIILGLALANPLALLNACQDTVDSGTNPGTKTQSEMNETPGNPASDVSSEPITSIAADPMANYVVTVDGLVNNILCLNYESILQFPTVTKSVTLTCPGVFEETAQWTGVPIIILIEAAGVLPGASQVIVSCADYAAPFSIQEQGITSGDIFLAFELNGQSIPADRGFPVRLVVPNLDGSSWVRGVTRIKVV